MTPAPGACVPAGLQGLKGSWSTPRCHIPLKDRRLVMTSCPGVVRLLGLRGISSYINLMQACIKIS